MTSGSINTLIHNTQYSRDSIDPLPLVGVNTCQSGLIQEWRSILQIFFFFFIRDVYDHLNYEHRVFNSEEFLKSREPADQKFYKMVMSVKSEDVVFVRCGPYYLTSILNLSA